MMRRANSDPGTASAQKEAGEEDQIAVPPQALGSWLDTQTAVRPFISSTFKDFADEREVLVKHIFPPIAALCERRDAEFAPVDLRWGITGDQSNSGQVIRLCLENITWSAPWFICMLGERYGEYREQLPHERAPGAPAHWLDSTFETAARHPAFSWLAAEQFAHFSVTELEIQHAVFNKPQLCPHCFFYFRKADPARLQPDHKYRDLGADAQRRLRALKARIEVDGASMGCHCKAAFRRMSSGNQLPSKSRNLIMQFCGLRHVSLFFLPLYSQELVNLAFVL